MDKQSKRLGLILFLIVFAIILFAKNTYCQVLPTPLGESKNDNSDLTVGMRFSPKQKSIAHGLRYYRDANFTGSTVGHLWDASGKKLADGVFPQGTGWLTLSFISPVLLDSGVEYICSFSNDGGFYVPTEFYFPKTFPLFRAITSHYTWYRNQYPTLTYNQTNYSVEPILQKYTPPSVIEPDPPTQIIRDTIYLVRDTCSIDYTKINDLTFVLVLPDSHSPGGVVRLPDSTTLYQAMYGKIPPGEEWVDLFPRVDRYLRTITKNGVTKTYQYTNFYNGTWVRRLKDANGVWKIVDDGIPPLNQ